MTPYQKQLREALVLGLRNLGLYVFGCVAFVAVMVAAGYTWDAVEPHIPEFEKRTCCCK